MLNQRTAVSLLVLAASIAAQERDDERKAKPDPLAAAWQQALERAKVQKAPILAFVLPPAEAKAPADRVKATWLRERDASVRRARREKEPPALTARDLLLRQLQLLRMPDVTWQPLEVKATRSQALLALTIPVVVAAEHCGAKQDETVVLLGPDGRRLQGFAIDLADAAAFFKQVGEIVLEPTALAARRVNVPVDVARDLKSLPVETLASGRRFGVSLVDPALAERLVGRLAAAAPALVGWVGDELDIQPAVAALEAERLPLGTEARRNLRYECMISCGMGFTPPALTDVLKLIGP